MSTVSLHLGDCLDIMHHIQTNSVDAIIADLPYGTTKCGWDVVIPFKRLWELYSLVKMPHTPIILFGTQPFTSIMILSRLQWFKYCWTWDKITARGHLVAKIRPMQQTEDIVVFGEGKINYYPIMVARDVPIHRREYRRTEIMGGDGHGYEKTYTHTYPKTILKFSGANLKDRLHPTQKPVPLLEYLVRTYTKPGDVVLDNTMGSGSTGVACILQGRDFIGIEKDKEIFERARDRLNKVEGKISRRLF